MRYYYVAQTDKAIIKKIATKKARLRLQDCYSAIGCDWVEMVGFKFAGKSYTMIVDEEGKLTDQPLNPAASYLYNNPYDCVAGKAVIVKTQGWATFTEEQAIVFDEALKSTRNFVPITVEEVAENDD